MNNDNSFGGLPKLSLYINSSNDNVGDGNEGESVGLTRFIL